jgi:crotonobetainyl-CoA:carnitine CoA-transferase CaiB-like acyl-CoA transferase
VNDVAGALEDPQAVAREAVVETQHDVFGTVRTIASPLRVGDERREPSRAPRRGEDTARLLEELCGYTRERLDELASAGAFGPSPLTSDPA